MERTKERRGERSGKTAEPVEFVDPVVQAFDWAIVAILFGLLVFLPAAMGTYKSWNEAIALDAAFAAAIVLGLKLIARPELRFVWSWTYLPIAALVVYVCCQLIPLSPEMLRMISPASLADRLKMYAVLPADIRPSRLPLSFYPYGTMHDLRNLLVTIAVFIVSLNLTRRLSQMKLLLWAIAIVGTLSSLLQIVQLLSNAPAIYWMYPMERSARVDSGAFPNHNFFSQFTNISSGAAVALFLLAVDETFRRSDYTPTEMIDKLMSRPFRKAYFLIGMLAINVAGVFLSLSRGGVLSILIAGVFTSVLLALRGGRRGVGMAGWFGGLMILFVFALVLASGAELVEARIKSIGNTEDRYDRLQLSKDSLDLWRQYPLTGSGFGSFRYVFPRFDRSNTQSVATHAEDEYVELLAELGIVGSVCIFVFGAMIAMAFVQAQGRAKRAIPDTPTLKSIKSPQPREATGEQQSETRPRRQGFSVTSSVAIGIGYGLMAMLVQSTTDFAPHFLPVSCVAAVLCASLISLATIRRQERRGTPAIVADYPSMPLVIRRRILRATTLLICCGVMFFCGLQANTAWSAEDAWQHVDENQKEISHANGKDVHGLVKEMNYYADEAVRLEPTNLFYQFWRSVNCGYSLSQSLSPQQRWAALMQCTSDLQHACLSCPTHGPVYCQIGAWKQNELGQWLDGVEPIRLALWLAPQDSTVQFIAGGLSADEKNWSVAVTEFRKAIALSPGVFSDTIDLFITDYHRPDLLLDIVGTDIQSLQTVCDSLRQHERLLAAASSAGTSTSNSTGTVQNPPHSDSSTATPSTDVSELKTPNQRAIEEDERVAKRAEEIRDSAIETEAQLPDASADLLREMARMLVRTNRPAESLPYFQRSLSKNYIDYTLRYEYAQTLIAVHDDAGALQQLKIVLRQQPGNDNASRLSEQILERRALADPDVQKMGIRDLTPQDGKP